MASETRNWFDQGGSAYARYRPDYPPELATHLAGIAPSRRLALDVGCGNGQFTRQLAEAFDTVIGLDPSAEQIAHAEPHPRVTYGVAPAENLGLEDQHADLITAAQAAHWFDLPRFYAEARRVAAPGAVLALLSYGVMQLDPDLDARFQHFYTAQIGPYWPPERRLVDEGYRGIDFPFRELPPPRIDIVREWSAEALLGYISTWSAVRNAREAGKEAILESFSQDLLALWGDPAAPRTIRWPIAMRAGIMD
ncbi:class I SAM-dependent methyltransferase [Novosphingobium rosa]|uniref:class I SAM-dependent methyltransferase n=1 Tax=Novosphingobium rosa TaxID=76978 RepID=UPI000835B122|nr:class I SAM-dependent methyltransferase [Novosphingobium rosa]